MRWNIIRVIRNIEYLFFSELGLKVTKTSTMNVAPKRCLNLNRQCEEEETGFKTAIQKAKCDNSVTPISNYLQSKPCESQLINPSVLKELKLFLQTNCQMPEYVARIKCVLLFLDCIKKVSCESEKWDAAKRDLVALCTLCFLSGLQTNKEEKENRDELLVNTIHIVTDLMNVSPQVSVGIAMVFSSVLLRAFIGENLSFATRKIFLSTLARMVNMSTVEARHVVLHKQKPELRKLSDFMVTCGDYELQSTILAIILQLLVAAGQESDISQSLFPSYPAISEAFALHSFENFRSELRQFLNKVNSLSEKTLVYSIPCIAAFLDNKELRKLDEYTEFWVDFCISSKCLYVNHQVDAAAPHNLICITEKDVKQIVSSECNYIVNSKTVQCIGLDVSTDNINLLKIYFPKTELFSCLQKDEFIPLFGKKYQDASMVDTESTSSTKMNINAQNDSPDEIESPPQQTQSNKKNKTKLMKSVCKNLNKNRPTNTTVNNNNNKRSKILETENKDTLSDCSMGVIRKRNSSFFEQNTYTSEKDNNNNNNEVSNEEDAKKDNRSNDFQNIMPVLSKKRKSNETVVNGKLSPVNVFLHGKETRSNKSKDNMTAAQNSLEKRKLYSLQNEDYMFSSVEEYTASLPSYYKAKREKKNDPISKVTYSYRANRSVENKIEQQDMLFSEMLESMNKSHSLAATPKHFPMRINVPKNNKLKKKQIPMEINDDDSAGENKFFKSNKFTSADAVWKKTPTKKSKKTENTKSVYSDLSSSDTGTIHVNVPLNTYSRKSKLQQKKMISKNKKIAQVNSDTDSDCKALLSYVNTKPVQRCTRQRHRQNSVVALVNRELDEDQLRDCSEAESSEELPLCVNMSLCNETTTAKHVQSAPMPLLPEIATVTEDNFENDETVLLQFSPMQKSQNNFIKQKTSAQEKPRVSDNDPVPQKRKYLCVKNKKNSRKKHLKISDESSAISRPHEVITVNSQSTRKVKNIKVNNTVIENEANSSRSRECKTPSSKKSPSIIDQSTSNSEKDIVVNNIKTESGKTFNGSNQHKNISHKKKSGVVDRNSLFHDLTAYCNQSQLPESSTCSQGCADVHETLMNNELNNSQSSVRSSYRIKDLTHKDDLCRFGDALTIHMKRKLTNIQDEFKTEREVQYSEVDTVLVREMKCLKKQKQELLSVAKEMEKCRKILEEAFSAQMKTCEKLEKSIENISDGKNMFLKEVRKTEDRQSSQVKENINVFKEKMRSFVNTFIAADKKSMEKHRSQLKVTLSKE